MRDQVEFLVETEPHLSARDTAEKVFKESEAEYSGELLVLFIYLPNYIILLTYDVFNRTCL